MKSIFPTVKQFYKIHIIVWLLYIFYEVSVATDLFSIAPNITRLVIFYVLNIGLFYVHAGLFYKIGQKYWLMPLLILAEVFAYCIIDFMVREVLVFLEVMKRSNDPNLNLYFARTIWRALYFIGFSTGFVYIVKALEESKHAEQLKTENLLNSLDNQRLENELVRVENNYLRSQINPHFLFNTLSFIYNGTRKTAPDAASAILSLSEMMRYALKQPGSADTIYIKDEIEQVQNLINLHQLRTKKNSFIELKTSDNLNGVKFLPLMLLTLVENVFKHGNLAVESDPAIVEVKLENNILQISTENLIADKQQGESNNVGMENITKRLHGYYKESAKMSYSKKAGNKFLTFISVQQPHSF